MLQTVVDGFIGKSDLRSSPTSDIYFLFAKLQSGRRQKFIVDI